MLSKTKIKPMQVIKIYIFLVVVQVSSDLIKNNCVCFITGRGTRWRASQDSMDLKGQESANGVDMIEDV